MSRHKITFASAQDATVLALAKIGASDSLIARECKVTQSQISYRLRKAKLVEGHDHGYRVAWRTGESEVFRMVRQDVLAILRREAQERLPRKIQKVALEKVKA